MTVGELGWLLPFDILGPLIAPSMVDLVDVPNVGAMARELVSNTINLMFPHCISTYRMIPAGTIHHNIVLFTVHPYLFFGSTPLIYPAHPFTLALLEARSQGSLSTLIYVH